MDLFQTGAAVDAAARVFFSSARRSGRTTALALAVKPGDIVVFRESAHARQFLNCLRELVPAEVFTAVNAVVVEADLSRVADRMRRERFQRLWFDHAWLEDYYVQGIGRMRADLASLHTMLNGKPGGGREAEMRWQPSILPGPDSGQF